MKILRTIETEKNPRGLCALSSKIVKRKSDQGEEEDEGNSYSNVVFMVNRGIFVNCISSWTGIIRNYGM
jgi:hypothetical protein